MKQGKDDINYSEQILFQYSNVLSELEHSIKKARELSSSKRHILRLQRKLEFLRAYTGMMRQAIPILRHYHNTPAHVVNRFWESLDYTFIIKNNWYPGMQDFFEWYCNSDTIGEELPGSVIP